MKLRISCDIPTTSLANYGAINIINGAVRLLVYLLLILSIP